MAHPVTDLDETVHQRTRLGILALLQQGGRLDFATIKIELEATDGNLSQHLRVLEAAALVKVEKGYAGRRPRTWLSLTRQGKRALERELAILRLVAGETQPVRAGAPSAATSVVSDRRKRA